MTALEELLAALKDPKSNLLEQFDGFLKEFAQRKQLALTTKEFFLQESHVQELIVKEFFATLKKQYTPAYEIKLDDFLSRMDIGDIVAKGRFEDFLKSWTEQGEDDLEAFTQLDRSKQEEIFSRFQEEDLPAAKPKTVQDGVNAVYQHDNSEVNYVRAQEEAPLQQDQKDSSVLVEMAERNALEPDRSEKKKEKDPWDSMYR